MDARLLVRLTNTALVAAAGMTAGHLLMPARPTATPLARAAFVGIVAASGALAAWRERREALFAHGPAVRGRIGLWLATGAIAALLLAAIAWWLMHG